MAKESQKDSIADPAPVAIRKVEGREWWLWGFAVAVTLVLTFCILSLTFPESHFMRDHSESLILKEWVRGLAGLVLLFDIYTVYQHLQLQRVRHRLSERERLFHLIADNAADMIAVVDKDGRRLYNSPSYEKVLGYNKNELATTPAIQQIHPDDQPRVCQAAEKAFQTGRGECLEYRIQHKDGSWRIFESTSSPIPSENGGAVGLVIVNRDVTQRKQAEALLEHRTFHDGVTNLPNRALFLDRLQRSIAVSRRHLDFRFAVLFIDIDEFKVVNESMGHAAGDELLIQIGRRLTSCLRSADTISCSQVSNHTDLSTENTLARPGGDEFVVLAEELSSASDAIRMAKRILERLSVPFAVNNQELAITASLGIVFGSATDRASDVLRDAEIAMYRAKHAGKNRYQVFDSAMQAHAVKRLQLEADLRRALELEEFRVHYQPLVSLRDMRIVGFEALSRWQRPSGLVMPGDFMQVADETGIILSMNRNLLREACEQVRQWQSMVPSAPPFFIGANVTAKQFAQADLARQIGTVLEQTATDPGCVELEITENIAMEDADRAALRLSELKSLGVRLSIDDFGTGYSSLSRLQRFPVDALKIDRSFISSIEENTGTEEIVRVIVNLAHTLGLKVVAEGIEKISQLDFLTQIGCEVGQGYLFSRPADAGSMEQLLKSHAVHDQVLLSKTEDTQRPEMDLLQRKRPELRVPLT